MRIPPLVAAAFLLASAPPAAAQSLAACGFDSTVEELVLLERLDASVRYDPEPMIAYDWRAAYDRIAVVELPAVENRYALFESDRKRRSDIAIRGTVNLKNALFDVEFLKRRSPELGVALHSGFEKVAYALYADLRPRLRREYAVRVSGHSLGAAEAIIVAMLLSRDGFRIERVLASAPPKVTDAAGWARFASLPVLRVAAPYDPVPFLPPRGPVYEDSPYIQGGGILLLLGGSRVAAVEGSYFDDLPSAMRQVVAEKRHFDVAEHLMPNYLARLFAKEGKVERVDPAEWERYAK